MKGIVGIVGTGGTCRHSSIQRQVVLTDIPDHQVPTNAYALKKDVKTLVATGECAKIMGQFKKVELCEVILMVRQDSWFSSGTISSQRFFARCPHSYRASLVTEGCEA